MIPAGHTVYARSVHTAGDTTAAVIRGPEGKFLWLSRPCEGFHGEALPTGSMRCPLSFANARPGRTFSVGEGILPPLRGLRPGLVRGTEQRDPMRYASPLLGEDPVAAPVASGRLRVRPSPAPVRRQAPSPLPPGRPPGRESR